MIPLRFHIKHDVTILCDERTGRIHMLSDLHAAIHTKSSVLIAVGTRKECEQAILNQRTEQYSAISPESCQIVSLAWISEHIVEPLLYSLQLHDDTTVDLLIQADKALHEMKTEAFADAYDRLIDHLTERFQDHDIDQNHYQNWLNYYQTTLENGTYTRDKLNEIYQNYKKKADSWTTAKDADSCHAAQAALRTILGIPEGGHK